MPRPTNPKSSPRSKHDATSKRSGAKANGSGSARPQVRAAPPPPAPLPRYFVRCTFVGEDKKLRLEGSFRFVAEAPDPGTALVKLEKAVKKLRRTKDLPPRCDVYVEFVLELADAKAGVIADFERWEREPRRFQLGHITQSETAHVFTESLPTYHFGKPAEPPKL